MTLSPLSERPLSAVACVALAILFVAGCSRAYTPTDATMPHDLDDFAARYTAAWSSQDPARVASFFAEDGSLTVNDGEPAVGRAAITEVAQGFMTAFPDMVVAMDSLHVEGDVIEYHWTLTGTNTGPGGTGHAVDISGYEEWTLSDDGLIARSLGHFDEAEYQRQLEHGEEGRSP
ncbi:MAG: nuclear transport factor 2 family protein [Rubricoccaceae bacterium]|nr:nuclear transport factor 2 family protein [Rubricoccaceae bacterium]